VVQSPNFIPIVAGIVVDIIHAVDAVEVVSAWAGVADDMPFCPRAIADGTDGSSGVGPGEVANHARVSNVEVTILTRGRRIKIGRSYLNERQWSKPGEYSSQCNQRTGTQPPMP